MPDFDYSKYTDLIVEKKDKIATITINRPKSYNSITTQCHGQLEDVMEDMMQDDDVNVVILTGAGKAFCSGGDIKYMKNRLADPTVPRMTTEKIVRLVRNMLDLDKPLIAAVNGDATGLGATLALMCDITYVAETARIGDTHVRMAIVAGDGGPVIWPFLIGMHRAKEFLMTGDLITARDAEKLGLVSYVVPTAQVMPAAMAMARKLADGPSKAIRWTKRCCNKPIKDVANHVLDAASSFEHHTIATQDHKEAVDAFLNKRKPHFIGK